MEIGIDMKNKEYFKKTIYKNGNVLSMKTDGISYHTDIVVEKGVITEIRKNAAAEYEDTGLVDCTGKYLMPSLFDSHAHLNSSEMCSLFIANGITSIRHLSGGSRVKKYSEEIMNGERIGPYVYSSGLIYDGWDAKEKFEGHVYLSTVEEAEKAVYDTIESGYQWVKTYPSISPEQLKRLMDTANACGIKVCGHMSYFVDAKELRDWGYHCCEHSSSLPKHESDVIYLAKSGMWFCPTQVVCETLPDYVWNGKKLSDLKNYEYVPGLIRRFWEERNEKIIKGYKNRGLRPDINVIIERGKTFMEHSNRYLAGSDTMYPGMIAGFSLHDELCKLVELYGRTPYEALEAATVNPSVYCGSEDSKGTLAKGKDADILILDKNPLADIRNTKTIYGVIQGGRYFNRQELDRLLEGVRALPDEKLEIFERLF
ncbi:amidohydrolase family protein [Sedimentibacter sp.]|uniref:amidohydrolase family protein n=3 Tax=Sedimentibacter sp. TaxID=1960295 RepID=UPI0028AE3AA5|nr:amidohydrolase family protein [Sedimentibacter sp.]